MTRHELVENHCIWIHVRFLRVRVGHLLGDHFGRHPQNRSGWLIGFGERLSPLGFHGGQTEIAYFHRPLFTLLLVYQVVESVYVCRVGLNEIFGSRVFLFGYEKDVIWLQVPMQDISCVQILHASRNLFGNIDELVHFPTFFFYMQMSIQTRARAPLGYYSQVRLENAPNKQKNVIVSCRFENGYLVPKRA